MAVSVGVGDGVSVGVAVSVGVGDGVSVGVAVSVGVGVGVSVGVGVLVGVLVTVDVAAIEGGKTVQRPVTFQGLRETRSVTAR